MYIAAGRVLGATLRTAEYDDELAALPGSAGIRLVAQLHAKAASQAHTNYLNTFAPPEGFVELIEQLKAKRDLFLGEAEVLVNRKVVHAEQLEGLQRTTGYRSVINDMKRLTSLLREVMPRIAGKSFLTIEEVTTVSAMAETADKMLELRDDKEQARVEANDTRQRAFTLLVKSYEQLRRGLTYILADQAKLDDLAPTMQTNARHGRAQEDEEPVPAPAAGAASGAPATPAGSSFASTSAAAAGGAAKPGMPGSSPFIDG